MQPTSKPDYDKDILEPLRVSQKQKADKEAADALEAARQAEDARQAAIQTAIVEAVPSPAFQAQDPGTYLVSGVFGYSLPNGNCINQVTAYGKWQPGNPITWIPTTNKPFLGAAVLFYFNHTARLVGWYSNGDIEVAQENSPGAPHRYPQSMIRGYF